MRPKPPNLSQTHVVLDLDHTLICAVEPHRVNGSAPDFWITVSGKKYAVFRRPHLDAFLTALFARARSVSVWTAATKGYANAILKRILTDDQRKRLKFVWSRNRTVTRDGVPYLKELSKLYAAFPGMHHRNTVLLDDNPYHRIASPYSKVWFIQPFLPSHRKDQELPKTLKRFG